jgi:hypothetical protein
MMMGLIVARLSVELLAGGWGIATLITEDRKQRLLGLGLSTMGLAGFVDVLILSSSDLRAPFPHIVNALLVIVAITFIIAHAQRARRASMPPHQGGGG